LTFAHPESNRHASCWTTRPHGIMISSNWSEKGNYYI
jgi:hypothetical protein